MHTRNIPTPSAELSLQSYMRAVREIPMLNPEEEYMLAKRYGETGDRDAAHKLVTSHLKLVVKVALGYRGYGLPLGDIISEGNIGLMNAVKKFDPERGFRLSTYAMFWIKAHIHDYILKSWSLVKIGTSNSQKKLFFNLKKLKNKLAANSHNELTPDEVSTIAKELDVPEKGVVSMDLRLSGRDSSLNQPMANEEGSGEWQEWLPAKQNIEEEYAISEELTEQKRLFKLALEKLSERDKEIIINRRLKSPPATLDTLSKQFKISKERVRQLELAAMDKLRKEIASLAAA